MEIKFVHEVYLTKTNLQKYFHCTSLNQNMFVHVQCRELNKVSKRRRLGFAPVDVIFFNLLLYGNWRTIPTNFHASQGQPALSLNLGISSHFHFNQK